MGSIMKKNEIKILDKFLNKNYIEKLTKKKKISGNTEVQIAKRLKRVLKNTMSLLPRGVYSKEFFQENNDAVLMLIDISGFTRMTEKLTGLGKEGAEEITRLINEYFDPIIKWIFDMNGDVINFGGDSIEAIFPGLDDEDTTYPFRALDSAFEIMKISKQKKKIETRHGSFSIGIHIVLELGVCDSVELGGGDLPRKYNIFSNTSFKLLKLENKARKGEIIIGSGLLKKVNKYLKTRKLARGIYKCYGYKETPDYKVKSIKSGKLPGEIKELVKILERYNSFLIPGLMSKVKLSHKSAFIGEHRRGAIVFLNTIFSKNIDREQLLDYFNKVQNITRKYGGVINKINFDEKGLKVLILFGFPYSHEDDEIRSVMCSREIIEIVQKNKFQIKQKVGINAGSVFAGIVGSNLRQEYTVMGDAVNIAARIMKKAKSNSIVVAEPVYKNTMHRMDYHSLKPVTVKGKRKAIKVYNPVKEIKRSLIEDWLSESRKLIGRNKEIKLVRDLLNKSKKGKSNIISILGEAGVGKSRFIREIISISLEKKFKVILGDCHSYGQNISYLPWKSILRSIFKISETDSIEKNKTRIKKVIKKVNKDYSNWISLIFNIMDIPARENNLVKSLDAKLRQQRTYEIITGIIKYLAKNEPLLLIIEDVHWIDNASIDLLKSVTSSLKNEKITIILGARELPPGSDFLKGNRYSQISLKEFTKDESMELIKSLINIKNIPDKIQNYIMNKSQGNPFYVEEVIKSFLESGLIVKRGKRWVIKKEIKKVDIPNSVQDVIMSRIDRLPEETRRVLQTASVIGREFNRDLLIDIQETVAPIDKILDSLKRLDLILLKEDKEIVYFFKHILTREVAYESLPFYQRRNIHNVVGENIESKHKRRLKEKFDILAHHYYNANNWYKAFIYSMEAAEKAQNQFSNQEALSYYDQSLSILDHFSDEDYDRVIDLIKDELNRYQKRKKMSGKKKKSKKKK